VEGYCEVYHVFQRKYCVHFDPIWYQVLIYCGALVNWCHHFGICFNVNFPMVHGQEFSLIAKFHHHPTRAFRLLELMCFPEFIQGAHINLQ